MPAFRFTPVEKLILRALADGQPHYASELMRLSDAMGSVMTLYVHVHNLRKKLLSFGEYICADSVHRRLRYRHVILLPAARNGRRANGPRLHRQ